MPDICITFRVDQATHASLQAAAGKVGVSLSEFVRQAVAKRLKPEDPLADVLRRAVDEALRPHVNRLAALTSKAVIQAASAKWIAAAITEHLAELPPEVVRAYPDQDQLLADVRPYALEDLKARRQAETVTEVEAQRIVDAGTETP